MRRSMENGASDIRRPQGVLKRKGLSKFYSSKSQSFSSMELALATGYGTSALALAKRPSCAELLCSDLIVPAAGSGGMPKLTLRTASMAAATTQGINSSSPLSRSSVDNVFSPPHYSSHHMAFSCGGALQGSTSHQHQHPPHYSLRSHHASLRHTSCQPAQSLPVDMDVLEPSHHHHAHLHHSPPSAAHLSLLLQARSCARSASSSGGGGAAAGFLQQPRCSLTGAPCAGSPPCPTLCPTLGEDTEYVTLNLGEDDDDDDVAATVPGTPLVEEGVTLSGLSTGGGDNNRSGSVPPAFPSHVLLPPGISVGSSTHYTGSTALQSSGFTGDPGLTRQGLSTSLPSPVSLTQASSPQLPFPHHQQQEVEQRQRVALGLTGTSSSLFGAPVCMQLSTEQLCAALNMSQHQHHYQLQSQRHLAADSEQVSRPELSLPLSSSSFDAAAAAMAGLQLGSDPRLRHNDSALSCGTPLPGDGPSGSLTSGSGGGGMAHQFSVSSGMDRSTGGDSSNHSSCRAGGWAVQQPRTPECTVGGAGTAPSARQPCSRTHVSLTARDTWTSSAGAASFHSRCPTEARSMAYE